MKNEVLLSIVIPVFRVEKYLSRCVDALLQQITSEVEVILVDDGSDDSCPRMCDEYSTQYSFIKTIHKKNGGLASAVTVGVENSLGSYIGFCDSDDWVSDDYIASVLSVLKTNDVDVISFDYQRIQEWDGKKYESTSSSVKKGLSLGAECEIIKKKYMRQGGINPNRWSKVVRRDMAIQTLETYDERISIGEDIVFTAPIIAQMDSIYYIDKSLLNYNINRQSMTQNFNDKYIRDFDLLFEALKDVLKDNKRMLGYINYINMRTMVNSVGKSLLKNKRKYLHEIFKDSERKERLKLVAQEDLDVKDKGLLLLMKINATTALLIISFLYRELKKYHG